MKRSIFARLIAFQIFAFCFFNIATLHGQELPEMPQEWIETAARSAAIDEK